MAYLITPKALPRYVRRYARAFSWKRLGNFLAVLASMGLSWMTRRPIVWGRPFMLMVEPTNFLQPQVSFVPFGQRRDAPPAGDYGLGGLQKAG